MRPLYTEQEFEKAKSFDKLLCECYQCNKPFYATREVIKEALNPNSKTKNKFCSKKCSSLSRCRKVKYNCHFCDKECIKKASQLKLSKSGYNFCSRTCTSSYHIRNKDYGGNRSKLEIWIEEKIKELYPEINIVFNYRNEIGYELDIYLPDLQLAFELNGIFHYEPIFGINKLEKIKYKDSIKLDMCNEKNINLYQIDTRKQEYFNEESSKEYLELIISKIKNKKK